VFAFSGLNTVAYSVGSSLTLNVLFLLFGYFNTLASARIRAFLEKQQRINARGFVWEFLRSGMLYRPGKSLKRRGKSSSLHSKKIFFAWGMQIFCE